MNTTTNPTRPRSLGLAVAVLLAGSAAVVLPVATSPAEAAPRCDRAFSGTAGDDTIDGDRRANRICARAGNDRVDARGGRDWLYGGRGSDLLIGYRGADQLFGGGEGDSLNGAAGADTVAGGPGNDGVEGGPGFDKLTGGAGNDLLIAADGEADLISCGDGLEDQVYYDVNLDTLEGDCEIFYPYL